MKKLIFGLAILSPIITNAIVISNKLLDTIATIESGNDCSRVNISEQAYGAYQIRQIFLDDANKFLNTNFKLKDMHNNTIAKRLIRIYLLQYGARYENKTGKIANDIILCKIFNGGPYGYKKKSTIKYALKFYREYNKRKNKCKSTNKKNLTKPVMHVQT